MKATVVERVSLLGPKVRFVVSYYSVCEMVFFFFPSIYSIHGLKIISSDSKKSMEKSKEFFFSFRKHTIISPTIQREDSKILKSVCHYCTSVYAVSRNKNFKIEFHVFIFHVRARSTEN